MSDMAPPYPRDIEDGGHPAILVAFLDPALLNQTDLQTQHAQCTKIRFTHLSILLLV